jgi:hypothetical protein
LVGFGLVVAILRTACVPVGSFRSGFERLDWGMPADSVRAVLGPPNRICTYPTAAHLGLVETGAEEWVDALERNTAERWIYTKRPPRQPIPRTADPACRAPAGATELGYDDQRRLRWRLREAGRTAVEVDPGLRR